MNSRCRRFDLLLFTVLAQSEAAIIAVVAARRSCTIRCRWPSIDRDRRTMAGHSDKHWRGRLGIRDSFGCFSRIIKFLGELRCELVTECAFSRYEQFETSPETIEQELRPGVCR